MKQFLSTDIYKSRAKFRKAVFDGGVHIMWKNQDRTTEHEAVCIPLDEYKKMKSKIKEMTFITGQ